MDEVDEPTVLVEISTGAFREIEQAVVAHTKGKYLRGLLFIAETDAGELRIAAANWLSPAKQTDMIKDAYHSVTCEGD